MCLVHTCFVGQSFSERNLIILIGKVVSAAWFLQKSEARCDSALGKLSVGISSSDETGSVSLHPSSRDSGISSFLMLEVPQQLLCVGFVSPALAGAVCGSALVVLTLVSPAV